MGVPVSAGVWLVTGAQASGKSTVAERLAQRFDRGVHVRGGQFYRWAVRGWVHVDGADQAEARRLLDLRYRLSARVADEYAAAGFTTVVQDNIYGPDVTRWLDSIRAQPRHLVVLRPSVAVVGWRHDERRRATGKVAYRGTFTPAENDAHVAATPRVGLWLDTSEQTPDETVDEILARVAEARLGERSSSRR
jgi:AAA domain